VVRGGTPASLEKHDAEEDRKIGEFSDRGKKSNACIEDSSEGAEGSSVAIGYGKAI